MPKKSKKIHHQSGGDVLLYNPENKTSVPFRVLPTMEPDQVAMTKAHYESLGYKPITN